MSLTHGSATCLSVTLDRLLSFSSSLVRRLQNDLPSCTEAVRSSSAGVQGLAHSRCSINEPSFQSERVLTERERWKAK